MDSPEISDIPNDSDGFAYCINSQIVALGICREKEKARTIGIVTEGRTHQDFPVIEGHFHDPTGGTGAKLIMFLLAVLRISVKLFYEENGLQIAKLDFGAFPDVAILLRK